MNDQYTLLSVTEAAKLLDSEPTFVYKLIRDDKLRPAQKEPMKLLLSSLTSYVKNRVPSGFTVEPVPGTASSATRW